MSEAITVVSRVLPVVLLIVLGHLLKRFLFLKPGTVEELKRIIVNISLPSMLFLTFAGTSFQTKFLLIFIAVFMTCVVMLLVGSGFQRIFNLENRYFPTLFSGFETGMMGYSLFATVFGTARVYQLALIDLGQVTFVFFVLATYLKRLNGQSASAGEITLSFIKSPVILSILAGIAAGSTGILGSLQTNPASNAVLETLQLLSGLSAPMICIVIGYELRVELKNLGKPLIAALVRLALLMGLAFLLNELLIDHIMQLDPSFKIALYTLFLLPPPFVIPIFMEDGGEGNKQFILNTLSIHILLSLIAFFVLILVAN